MTPGRGSGRGRGRAGPIPPPASHARLPSMASPPSAVSVPGRSQSSVTTPELAMKRHVVPARVTSSPRPASTQPGQAGCTDAG